MDEFLDDIEVRVLGSLMEKELTTPDNYPLTLKALTAACNQSSSRDPVMELEESEVARGLERLGRRTFARGIHPSRGRVMRFRQEIGETLHLHRPERAVLSVLMLRGPQTAAEIRTRTARAAEFVGPSHVEIVLDSLATLSTPLVTTLPRRPGQKEVRYAHLLAGPPTLEAQSEPPATSEPSSQSEPPATSEPSSQSEAPGDGRPSPSPLHNGSREESPGRGGSDRTDDADRAADADRIEALDQEIASLRDEVAELREQFRAFRQQFE